MTSPQEIMDMLATEQQKEAQARALSGVPSTEAPEEEDDADKLKKLFLTKGKLNQVKDDLNQMIDVMADNPSLFSRAAKYWGTIPLWQKIIGGILVVAPTLILGILFNINLLIAVTIFTLVSYVASSIILDNHYSHISDTTAGLKKGISGLADVLGVVIQSLDTLHQQLSNLVEAFQQENEKLTTKVGELGSQVSLLDGQVQTLQEMVSSLQQTKDHLEATASRLSNSVEENLRLLEESRQHLQKVQLDYEASQIKLSTTVAEFGEEKSKLSLEIQNAKEVNEALQAAVESLAKINLINDEQRGAYLEKLTTFVNDKDTKFNMIADKYEQTGRNLEALKEELQKTIEHYKGLITKQEQIVKRLEKSAQSKKSGASTDVENETPLYGAGIFQQGHVGHRKRNLVTATTDENPSLGSGLH